jgi:hypothetical protein
MTESSSSSSSAYRILELHVGYCSPYVIIDDNEGNENFFNFHLTINNFDWVETVEYRFLYDLNTNIIPFSDETEAFNQFPNFNTEEYASVHRLLSEKEYDEATVKLLTSHIRSMQTWMSTILLNLHKIDEESRQMLRQLFFRSEEKLLKYDHLMKLLKDKDLLMNSLREKEANGNNPLNRVFKTMTALFSLGGSGSGTGASSRTDPSTGRSVSTLSERNLEKHTKQQEYKAQVQQSKGNDVFDTASNSQQGGGDGIGGGLAKAQRKKSIFARSFGSKSARDKHESMPVMINTMGNPLAGINGKAPHTALDVAKNTSLLKVEVTRGNEAQQGVVMYDIILRMTGKRLTQPQAVGSGKQQQHINHIYKCSQRFSSFRKLWTSLNEINAQLLLQEGNGGGGNGRNDINENMTGRASLSNVPASYRDFIQLIKSPFPALPMKCYLGFSLNESELSQR